MMFIKNERRKKIEENMTLPSDAINSALDDFYGGTVWERWFHRAGKAAITLE